MPRLYTVSFTAQTITTAGGDRDLFYVAPADDKPCRIVGWDFAQTSDLGDAAEEVLSLNLIRGHTTVGSGGSAATPADVGAAGGTAAAASATCRTNDTTIASLGTGLTIYAGGYNIRAAPAPFFLPDELRVPVTQAEGSIVLRLMAAPADDITMNGTLWFLEGL